MDNHIIALEPFLKYNLGPLSWAYERMRIINGKLFGFLGRSIHRYLEWYHTHHVCALSPGTPTAVRGTLHSTCSCCCYLHCWTLASVHVRLSLAGAFVLPDLQRKASPETSASCILCGAAGA